MKPVRLILSLVGLAAIILAYVTGRLEFLIVALIAFIVGLYYMGAVGRKSTAKDRDSIAQKKKTGNVKDKSQEQQQ